MIEYILTAIAAVGLMGTAKGLISAHADVKWACDPDAPTRSCGFARFTRKIQAMLLTMHSLMIIALLLGIARINADDADNEKLQNAFLTTRSAIFTLAALMLGLISQMTVNYGRKRRFQTQEEELNRALKDI